MKLSKLSALCFAATTMFAASSAMAWESEDGAHSTSASVALSSEYVWRGYSNSDEKPAISGSFDYSHSSGFYAGTWASNVEYGDEAVAEVDIYAGFASEFGESGIGYDVGVLRYIFPGEDYNWNEVYGSLSYSYFSVGVAHSSNVYNSDEDGTYWSAGFDYDLPYGLALSAGVGYYDYDDEVFVDDNGVSIGDSATDWRLGISKEFAGFTWDITYTETDSDGEDLYGEELAEDRFIFSVSSSF